MDLWNKIPFIRLIIPLILGVVCEICFRFQGHEFILTALMLSLFTLFHFLYRYSIKLRWVFGVLVYLTIFFLSISLSIYNREIIDDNHVSNYLKYDNKYVVRIVDVPVNKEKTIQLKLKVLSIINEKVRVVNGHLIAYIEKSKESTNLFYGDELIFQSQVKNIEEAKNPHQFNYKRFLENNNIYQQVYIKSGQWKKISSKNGSKLKYYAFKSRMKLLNLLEFEIKDDDNLAVGFALLLGYKDRLDKELLMTYSAAGAMHVLAVSGLHVGIIYVVLNFFLGFLDKRKNGKWLKALILILFLWCYALITGLSPSVLRSATMFSFIIVGGILNRPVSIYNSLGASAFILIILDPLIITKVGFQLSYLAVLGIVYLQPKIRNLIYVKPWLLRKVWEITCVSVAAQIATFPLGLYYFHQFPNLFFVSNLVVIPMAALILYAGITFFIFQPFGPFEFFTWILNLFLSILNWAVKLVDSISISLTYGIHITRFELLMMYLAIFFFVLLMYFKKFKQAIVVCVSVILVLISFGIRNYENVQSKQLIIYHVNNKSIYNCIDGRNNILIAEKEVFSNESLLRFNVKQHWFFKGFETETKRVLLDSAEKQNNFFYNGHCLAFHDIKIDIINENYQIKNSKKNIVLLKGNAFLDVELMVEAFKNKKVVLDASLSYKKDKFFKNYLTKHGIDVWSVKQQGALVLNL